MCSSPRRAGLVALLLLTGALGGACTSSDGDEADRPGPDQLLTGAASAMADVESAAFVLAQTGADVPIDEAGQLGFRSAEGRIARPSSAEALVTVEALGFTTEVGAIAIDGTAWFTNPLTGAWEEAPAGFTFDPAALLDPDTGLPALLDEAVGQAEPVEDDGGSDSGDDGGDPRPVDSAYGVVTTVAGGRVAVLTGGLIDDQTTVELWIDRETQRVAEVRFDLTIGGAVSSWRLTITDYDLDVDIAPPDLGVPGS